MDFSQSQSQSVSVEIESQDNAEESVAITEPKAKKKTKSKTVSRKKKKRKLVDAIDANNNGLPQQKKRKLNLKGDDFEAKLHALFECNRLLKAQRDHYKKGMKLYKNGMIEYKTKYYNLKRRVKSIIPESFGNIKEVKTKTDNITNVEDSDIGMNYDNRKKQQITEDDEITINADENASNYNCDNVDNIELINHDMTNDKDESNDADADDAVSIEAPTLKKNLHQLLSDLGTEQTAENNASNDNNSGNNSSKHICSTSITQNTKSNDTKYDGVFGQLVGMGFAIENVTKLLSPYYKTRTAPSTVQEELIDILTTPQKEKKSKKPRQSELIPNEESATWNNTQIVNVECHLCHRKFYDADQYINHLKKCYKSHDLKWLVCDSGDCGHTSKDVVAFCSHINTHAEEGLFRCNIEVNGNQCKVTKRNKYQMRDHINSHYGGKKIVHLPPPSSKRKSKSLQSDSETESDDNNSVQNRKKRKVKTTKKKILKRASATS